MSENGANHGRPDLPEGWEWAAIGEVATLVRGVTFKKAEAQTTPAPGYTPVLRSGNVQRTLITNDDLVYVPSSRIKDRQFLQPGDTVISVSNSLELVGKAAFLSSEWKGSFGAFLTVVRPGPDVNPRFLATYAQSPTWRAFIRSVASATNNIANINKAKLEAVPIPLPPIHKQEQIVDHLDKDIARIASLEAEFATIRSLERQFREAFLRDALAGFPDERMDAHGLLPTAHGAGQESSSRWPLVSPETIAAKKPYALAIGPFGSNLKVEHYRDSGVPLVFVRNIRSELFGGPNQKYVDSAKAQELSAHEVVPGDLLITKMGDPPGDVSIYPEHMPSGIITADCVKMSVDPALASTDFLYWLFKSAYVRSQILCLTKGVAQKKISLKSFRSLRLPLPPLEEQRRIASAIGEEFARLERARRTISEAEKGLESTRRSLIHKALLGRLGTVAF